MSRRWIVILIPLVFALFTVSRWMMDGMQILTKQQMVVQKVEKDAIFGTDVTKTEYIDGFWLGVDFAAPVIVVLCLMAGFIWWKTRPKAV